MKKTVLAIALGSMFGFGSLAHVGDGNLTYPGCAECESIYSFEQEGEWENITRYFGYCQRTGKYCGTNLSCDKSSSVDFEKDKIVNDILEVTKGDSLRMVGDVNIAMEMADVNPWAAESFLFIYTKSEKEGSGILENSEFVSMDSVDSASFTSENAKKVIRFHLDDTELSKEEVLALKKNGVERVRTVHEVTKTADGGAWLNIRISAVDGDFKEIKRIMPDVRVKLIGVRNGEDAYWKSTSWEVLR